MSTAALPFSFGSGPTRATTATCCRGIVASHIDHESRPGASTVSDAEIIDAALDDGYCGYHAVGTAATGLDRGSVVDETLQVRGVDGLSALDASVLPTMVSGNLNGPLMAMAWMAAPMIQDRC